MTTTDQDEALIEELVAGMLSHDRTIGFNSWRSEVVWLLTALRDKGLLMPDQDCEACRRPRSAHPVDWASADGQSRLHCTTWRAEP